ncbi:MAG: BatA domain-containing protein [Planctomycetaceae bacterium]|jgi:hypothetical protein|nr:BatA domain-containing protein [Planctomycetaceae bacterium]
MSFITLGLIFGGTAAAAIPVLFHLMMRGRPKKLEFPALRFLRQRLQTNQRKFRLKHLILLGLRMLLLILLGILLARPVLRLSGTLGSQESPVAAAIIFDTSPRMDYLALNQTRLDEAKKAGQWILNQLPQESSAAILSSQRMPDSFQVDFRAARERIDRLTVSTGGRPVMESVAAAAKLLRKSGHSRREIYILTDLTVPGWPESLEPALQSALAELPGLSVHLLDVGIESPANSSMTQVELSEQVLSSRGQLKLNLDLSHIGPRESRTVELYLSGPNEPDGGRKRGTQTADFPEGLSRLSHLSFTLSDLQEGIYQGTVRFTTHDALPQDDAFYFTVEVQSAWNVLVVSPEPFDRHAVFLTEALQPSSWRKRGIGSFTVKTVSFPQFEQMTLPELARFRCVFLLDPAPLPPKSWKMLSDYTASGKGTGLFFGRRAEPAAEFQREHVRDLLGTTLKMQVHVPEGDVFLAPEQYAHPIFAAFQGISEEELPWNALPVFRYWQVETPADGTEILAPFSDGRAAILTRRIGRGNLLVMTTPVSDPAQEEFWNLLPTGEAFWLFPPLSEGIAKFLAGVGDENFNYLAGQQVTLRPETGPLPPVCVVMPPTGEGLRITPDQNRGVITYSGTDQVGNYRLTASGGGDLRRFQSGFSVNFSPGQWNLTRIPQEKLSQLFGGKLLITRDQSKIEREMAENRIGRELFPVLILLLLALYTAEYLFANRFYQ